MFLLRTDCCSCNGYFRIISMWMISGSQSGLIMCRSILSWSWRITTCGRSLSMNWDIPARVSFSRAEFQWKIFRRGWGIAITIQLQISTPIWSQARRKSQAMRCRTILPSVQTLQQEKLCKSEKRGWTRLKMEKTELFLYGESQSFQVVPVVGLEPTWSCPRRILNPLRLPIPSHRHYSVVASLIFLNPP